MINGVICETQCLQLKSPNPFDLLRRSTREGSCHCVCFAALQPPKPPTLRVENRCVGGCRFRTRAAVNDGFVAAAPAEELSFYQLLGIPESGSVSEIKQAYKQLARKYHPDVSPPDRTDEYTRRFILVQEAYETLSDPTRRALYDRDLSRGLHLAFSARKRYSHHRNYQSNQGFTERTECRSRWQDQLSELKRKSMSKDSGENMSWAARMRRQRDGSLGNQ